MSDNGTAVTTPVVEAPAVPVTTPVVEVETPAVPVTTPVVETPVATPATTPVVENWIDSLPEDLRGNEKLSSIKSVEDLARQYADTKVAPTVPDADKYVLPEGVPPEFGDVANKLGFSQEQLEGTTQVIANVLKAQADGSMDALRQQADAKIAEWGEASKANIQDASVAVNYWEKKVPGLKSLLDETGYGNHPLIMELFKAQGVELREGGFISSNSNTPQVKKSTAETLYPNQGR
jgi:hypothetical protein